MGSVALKNVDPPPAHSPFGPSSAHRWMACPASVQMTAHLPDQTSDYAKEGSIAHHIAEQCLFHKLDAAEFHGLSAESLAGLDERDVLLDYIIGDEMVAAVQDYLDYVRALPGEAFAEVRLNLSGIIEGAFGTADYVAYDADSATLYVVDLKYGQGVRVFAEGNEQGQMYAFGALKQYEWLGDIENVVIVIVQPRLDHIDEWETTPKALTTFANRAKKAAKKADSPNPEFGPGEKPCKFCRASGNCPAQAKYNLETARMEFLDDDSEPVSPHSLEGEPLAWVLRRLKSLQDWAKAVESRAASVIEAGQTIPGFKLVEGRSLRKWSDDRDVEPHLKAVLGEEAFTRKVISPAQAEKLLGKKHDLLSEWTVKPPGKPTLVPESDKRPALRSTAEQDFAD